MKSELIKGDSLQELKKYDDNSIDLLCTDPPYGYSFMGRDWDKTLPPKEIFEECFRVLKPGSMAFVMSAPRSDVQYRMAEMLEKVGFRIDYTPIYWTYASGFPKAMNISKMIDKQKKGERNGKSDEFATYIRSRREKLNLTKGYVDKEICDGSSMYSFYEGRNNENGDWAVYLPNKERYEKLKKLLQMDDRFDDFIDNTVKVVDTKDGDFGYQKDGDRWDNEYKITKPNSDKAKELDGSYGGFQPKPAVEVVIVAMKPLDKKGYLEQAQDNGKGITWFDDCRIPFADESEQWGNVPADDIRGGNLINDETKNHPTLIKNSSPMGRFPANLLVSDDVLDNGTEKKTKVGDYEKYVEKQKSFKNAKTIGKTIKGNEHFLGGDIKQLNPAENYQKPKKKKMTMPDLRDVGKKSKEAIGIDKLSFGQVENAERKEYEMWDIEETTNGYSRYFSLDNWFSKNIKLLPEPVQQTFPFMIVPKASKSEKNEGLDNFEEQFKAGADFRPNHKEKALKGEDGNPYGRWNKIKNIHPTVKPLTLMNYLVTLGSRKGDMVLDPFMGSGTTPLACVSLERKYIGIDNEQDYYEIAKARVDKLEAPIKAWEKFI